MNGLFSGQHAPTQRYEGRKRSDVEEKLKEAGSASPTESTWTLARAVPQCGLTALGETESCAARGGLTPAYCRIGKPAFGQRH